MNKHWVDAFATIRGFDVCAEAQVQWCRAEPDVGLPSGYEVVKLGRVALDGDDQGEGVFPLSPAEEEKLEDSALERANEGHDYYGED